MAQHLFRTTVTWTGNPGDGTSTYHRYSRDHEIRALGKSVTIPGSSAPAFHGDGARWNPEELLVASLAECHMLWYLHLCAEAGIVVTAYEDHSEGVMRLNADGSGEFVDVTLHPEVTIPDASRHREAEALHARAHELCFIARSVNFPVHHEPRTGRLP